MEGEEGEGRTRRKVDRMSGMMIITTIVLDQVKYGWIDMKLRVSLEKDLLVRSVPMYGQYNICTCIYHVCTMYMCTYNSCTASMYIFL